MTDCEYLYCDIVATAKHRNNLYALKDYIFIYYIFFHLFVFLCLSRMGYCEDLLREIVALYLENMFRRLQ